MKLVTEPMRSRVPLGTILAREDYPASCDVRLYRDNYWYRDEWQRLQLHCQQAACHVPGDLRDY